MIHPQVSLPRTQSTDTKPSRKRALLQIIALLAVSLLLSCVPAKEMTLQEAKEVTVSTSGEKFTPPPRSINDILAILAGTSQRESEVMKGAREIADSPLPQNVSDKELLDLYVARNPALRRLGLFGLAFDEAKEMVKLAEKLNLSVPEAYRYAAHCARLEGYNMQAIEFYERALPKFRNDTSIWMHLVDLYTRVGNFSMAKKGLEEGTRAYARLSTLGNPRAPWYQGNAESMRATFYEAEGKFDVAEPLRRRAIMYYKQFLSVPAASSDHSYGNLPIAERAYLVGNLKQQGRILEAEVECRTLLRESIEHYGKASSSTHFFLSSFGDVILRQGKSHEAEQLVRLALRNMNELGIPNDSRHYRQARTFLGDILTCMRNYEGAMAEYVEAYGKRIRSPLITNHNLILALIETGRFAEASDNITKAYQRHSRFYREQHYFTAEIKALRGTLNYRLKNFQEAFADFSSALPVLTGYTSETEADYLKRQRLIAILEAYLGLLKEIGKNQMQGQNKIDSVGESFKVADLLMGRSVSSAMSESSARAAVTDKDLADLMRREQDASRETKALETILANLAGMREDQQTKVTADNLRTRMEILAKARGLILDEVKARFPRYIDFTNPQPATLEKAQRSLRPNEALLVMYPAEKETYIWCVPKKGNIRFAISKLSRQDLSKIVGHLHKALAPEPTVFGDIPDFDVQKAHELYTNLLKPVEEGWKDARDLLIVAHGPLGQIPFSVLPTSAVSLKEDKGELFSKYKDVPWLVRKVAITSYPAVSSYLTLRTLPEGGPQRKAFVGFGDPVFAREQMATAQAPDTTLASRGGTRLRVRGIRISGEDKLDNKQIASMNLERLNRLPDTAEEVKDIARALGANPEQDTFTGERATEKQVKSMDLSDRRVIAFASHALLPWDLDGLDQPAIALSSPTVAGGDEDGLLTMSEIMKLRLNADWVVLSACNTGASEGEGAEAVSGLGRAFFYAGTRAVLVTMWPVETTSAKSLMTGLFSHYTREKGLSRAQAQRKAINEVIDNQSLKDPATGKIVASYAHPFFWAPYIIMGDGG